MLHRQESITEPSSCLTPNLKWVYLPLCGPVENVGTTSYMFEGTIFTRPHMILSSRILVSQIQLSQLRSSQVKGPHHQSPVTRSQFISSKNLRKVSSDGF